MWFHWLMDHSCLQRTVNIQYPFLIHSFQGNIILPLAHLSLWCYTDCNTNFELIIPISFHNLGCLKICLSFFVLILKLLKLEKYYTKSSCVCKLLVVDLHWFHCFWHLSSGNLTFLFMMCESVCVWSFILCVYMKVKRLNFEE